MKIPGFGLPSIPTTASIPEVGSRVIALGSPLGLSGSVSEGIVSAVRLLDGRQLIQTTAAISPGSSGGPLIDSSGKVFAVATESLEGRGVQQLNFGVPVKYAMGLLGGDVAERPLAGSPLGISAKHSDFAVSAADYASWSRPSRTSRPVDKLTGQYAFVSRGASSRTGALKGKSLGLIVLGTEVGLWLSPTAEGKVNVVPIGPLTTGAEGAVALGFSGLAFAGYQTDEGFWVSHESGEADEVLEIQTKRMPPQDGENGLYAVSCRTTSVGSLTVSGRSYPIREQGPGWAGDAAIIVAADQIYVDLLMRNDSGGSVRLHASGPLAGGKFDLKDGNRRLTGTLTAGVLQAQWVDERSPDLRFEGPLRGERR